MQAYSIARIAENVHQHPGAVAWSSDNRTLGFISDSLRLYDLRTGKVRDTRIKNAYFIAAGPGNIFYVIIKDMDIRKIIVLDPETLGHKDISVDRQPDGVIALPDNKGLLLVSARLTQKSLWAELDYSASLLDMKGLRSRTLHESKRIIQGRIIPSDHQSGWLWPGLRPYDSEFLTVEFVKPPVMPSYLKLGLVDFITGRTRDIGRIDHRKLSIPLSWSPDGSRLAFPDMNGRLGIYSIREKTAEILSTGSANGTYPSWNPAGSQIYFGGSIISSDGSSHEKLLDDAQDSTGIWSADGSMLAVTNNGRLDMISGFRPSFISPDRVPSADILKRRMLLKDLLKDRLISEKEYDERYDGLTDKQKE